MIGLRKRTCKALSLLLTAAMLLGLLPTAALAVTPEEIVKHKGMQMWNLAGGITAQYQNESQYNTFTGCVE